MGKNGFSQNLLRLTSKFAFKMENREYRYDMDIIVFFIKNLNLGKLILKVEFDWIYLKISTRANLKVLNTNRTSIFYYYVFER